ncbi:hypothetical protein [Methylobacterium aquaticum]|uniref:Uncharacterized protein n=1 Tax=Methylobacterium aquaticum TaxID=270351 RepID=A0A0J6SL12_9HYPH|nr:hypothetical protein [Methylobacterium aquaticum]KMO34307.1 hypothetical protein VP06_14650 [Methylobacterium aquaticum]
MAAKEMTVRACQQGGFVVYDRIQMVQNPDPIAAFGEIRPALDFVLKAMVPMTEVRVDAAGVDAEAIERRFRKTMEGYERARRGGAVSLLDPGHQPSGLQDQHLQDVERELATGRLVPRDEPLMEDDRS